MVLKITLNIGETWESLDASAKFFNQIVNILIDYFAKIKLSEQSIQASKKNREASNKKKLAEEQKKWEEDAQKRKDDKEQAERDWIAKLPPAEWAKLEEK